MADLRAWIGFDGRHLPAADCADKALTDNSLFGQTGQYEGCGRHTGAHGGIRGVAEAGSFTAAAERMEISKSALSQAVALLERELGTQLLQRSTRRIAITESVLRSWTIAVCCWRRPNRRSSGRGRAAQS
jgi:hypothetical protein